MPAGSGERISTFPRHPRGSVHRDRRLLIHIYNYLTMTADDGGEAYMKKDSAVCFLRNGVYLYLSPLPADDQFYMAMN